MIGRLGLLLFTSLLLGAFNVAAKDFAFRDMQGKEQRLADYKVPETVTWSAQALPRNANGKVMKRLLRDA